MMPLTLANVGEELTIQKIGGKPDVKKHLENLGFVVGSTAKLITAAVKKSTSTVKLRNVPITISTNVRLLPLMWPDAAQTDVTKQNVIPSPANADPDTQKDAASNSVFFMSESFSF